MDYRDIQNFSPIEIITGDSTPTSNKVIKRGICKQTY